MKHFLSFLAFLTLSYNLLAQSNWLSSAGGSGNDEALKNTVDNSGNIYTIGYFSLGATFGSTSLTSNGSGDVFVSKQNSAGNYLWVVKAGGPQSDRAYGIATDAFGNIFITGFFSGQAIFGSIVLSSLNSSQDIFVAKLDATGNFIWAKSFGGNDIDLAFAIETDVAGNCIITGQFRDTAQFGTSTLHSQINPSTGNPGFDIFILKLDANGNFIWVKQGAAKYDDRGITLATDLNNNIYVSGQFSDTLQFGNTYFNNGYNANFLLKLDSAGNEIWFRKLFATQILAYEIKSAADKIYMTGDFQGTLTVSGNSSVQLANPHQYKIFVLQFDSSGTVIKSHVDGSDNFITSLALDVDVNGNTFCAGLFKCVLTEYSQPLGNGVFNSVGFRDVFVSKYDTLLQRIWSRQYAGPHDDFCSAISVSQNNEPIIAGSFERNFNVPDGGNFTSSVSNHDSSFFGPQQNAGFCGDANYGNYISVSSIGNKDVFSAKPFDASRLPYDFFDRLQNNCVRDTLMPYINSQQDTIVGCDSVKLFITSRTGSDGVIGPEYDYQWSNGLLYDTIFVTTTGWYHAHFNYKDQCRIFDDSIYVKIFTTPPTPLLSTSIGNVVHSIPVIPCEYKLLVIAPDTAILTGSNIPAGYNFYWNTPYGMVNSINANAYVSGNYEFVVTAPGGGNCSSSSCVEVYYYDTANGNCLPQNFSPQIHFIDSVFDATDTVTVCRGELFSFILVDSTFWLQAILDSIPTFVAWNKTGGFHFEMPNSFDTTFYYHLQIVKADSSSNCSVTATVLNPLTLTPLVSVTRNFYLNVLPTPSPTVAFNGPSLLCPGDTVMLTLSGGDNYQCTGVGIVATSSASDTIWVNQQGVYSAFYLVTDPVSGCSDSGYVNFNLNQITAPLITMVPADGIACPNDSVLLTAQPGLNFTWYGPLGNVIATTQTVYVTAPGLYHYILTDSTGCTLVSEFKEVKAYTTPYILADPGPVLCMNGDSISLQIYTNDSTQIQWLPPLSGNSVTQIIDSAGTYSCTVLSCGVLLTVSINITLSNLHAQVIPQGPVTMCQNSVLTLQANSGMTFYNWMPGNINAPFYNVSQAGIYFVEITDIYGCTSIDSIAVDTFPEVPVPITSDVTICAGDSAYLSATANGNINWYPSSTSTTALATGSSFTTTAIFSDTTFYVSNSDSVCESIRVPVQVFINPVSLPPPISGDSILCRYDTMQLSTLFFQGVTYAWTGPNGFSSAQQNISVLNFDSTNVGYYHLQISDAQCSSPVDSFYVGLYPFHITSVTSNSPLCEGDSIILSANSIAGATFLWSGPNGFSSSQQNPIILNAQINQSGTYNVVVTENSCISNPVHVSVSVNSVPAIPNINGNTHYCTGETIQLQTTNVSGATYQWHLPNATLLSGSAISITADTTLNGIVMLTINVNGCSNQNTTQLTIAPEPAHTIVSNSPVCEHDTLSVATVSTANAIYYWSGPGGFFSSNNSNIIANALENNSGYYVLQVELNGCKSKKDSVKLMVYPYPVFDLMDDTTICEGTSFTVSVQDGFSFYNWNGLSYSNTFIVKDTGLVTLTVKNGLTCKTVKSFYVDAINCDVFIPNVFTPQGDGTNDAFEFIYSNAKNISLIIYNRWGNKIKTIEGTTAKWDGTNDNGKNVSAGTYFYVANVIDYFQKSKQFKGTIELIK